MDRHLRGGWAHGAASHGRTPRLAGLTAHRNLLVEKTLQFSAAPLLMDKDNDVSG